MTEMQNEGRSRSTFWLLVGLAVVAIIVLLYASFGGPDENVDDDANNDGIEAREDVDAVILPENGVSPQGIEQDLPGAGTQGVE